MKNKPVSLPKEIVSFNCKEPKEYPTDIQVEYNNGTILTYRLEKNNAESS